MKLVMPTVKFQDMVARSAKGATQNKLLPITSMLAIEVKSNVLTLTTTDTQNTLKVIADKINADDFYVVVPAELFSKLVARTTSENITLSPTDKSLEFRGNGVYNIPLPMDEDGVIRFPEYAFVKAGEPEIVHLSTVKNVLNINKAAVGKSLDSPHLCGYYFGEQVVTTDENAICFNSMKVFKEDALISAEMLELLALNTEEKISCYRSGEEFLFETPNIVLFGYEHDGKDVFPIDEVLGYLDTSFSSMCKLPKLHLQSVIDRLSLFIEPYDKNGAYFTFTKDGVKVTSKRSSSVEIIAYQESKEFAPFVCCIDISLLKAQIDANPSDFLELWYGHPSAIKLVGGKVTQVIALLDDENMEENRSDGE